jgi:hypothetical protein
MALAAGCAAPASGPEFSLLHAAPDKATLYVYRPSAKFNYGGYPHVFVNGEKKFALKDQGYSVLILEPGTYEIKFEGSKWGTNWWPPPATRTLSVEAGREYFVRAVPGGAPGPDASKTVPSTLVRLVPKQQALAELRRLRLVDE